MDDCNVQVFMIGNLRICMYNLMDREGVDDCRKRKGAILTSKFKLDERDG